MTIGATVPWSEAAARDWPIVVIGAGPAGALAARELARAGQAVLLVERKAFPRVKVCGACLNPRAVELLRQLGLAGMLDELRGVPIEALDLACRGQRVRLPLACGQVISRARFDAALVQAAIAAGACFLPQTTALLGELNAARTGREVHLAQPTEAAATVSAAVVLVADGLSHPSLAHCTEFRTQVARSARVGLGAVLPAGSAALPAGVIQMAVGNGGYVGMVQDEEGAVTVAAALDRDYLQAHGPAEAIRQLRRQATEGWANGDWHSENWHNEISTAAWQGVVPLTRRTSPCADTRVFLLGDAAGYIEPFTGEGMTWALHGAAALAPLALQASERWEARSIEAWRRRLRQEIWRGAFVCRALAHVLRHPRWIGTGIRCLQFAPGMAQPLLRRLSQVRTATVGEAT